MAARTTPLPGLAGADDFAGDRQFSINLSRGLQVLRAFTPADQALGNRDLCDRTGLPKATISRLTYTLVMLGYLTRTSDQRYALGAGVLSLGYPMLAGMRVRQIARPWLERLARQTGCTVNLGLRERLSVVYVDSCRADRGNTYRPDIGTILPLLTTSVGCALLAASPPAEQAAVLNRLRLQDPQRFRVERTTWERERAAFAARGYCSAAGDWRPDVHAIAVPLAQDLHPERMAINLTRKLERGEAGRLGADLAERLKDTARRVELACRAERGPARTEIR